MKKNWAFALVGIQAVLLIALVLSPFGNLWPRNGFTVGISVVLIVAGLLLAIWGILSLGNSLTASPIPREGGRLITTGAFSFVRNPIYGGLLIGGLGWVALSASWWHITIWVVLLAVLNFKARWEERLLTETHSGYREYAKRIGRFFPGIGKLK